MYIARYRYTYQFRWIHPETGVSTLIVVQLIGVSEHEETLATDVTFLD